ncbi:MAG: glucose-6-phosphate isomerase [Proteobacteria bacterium]|nr:glucose-6-phosphate isomerase [Pseudomonadota bacterium]
MTGLVSANPVWKSLALQAQAAARVSLRELFAADDQRWRHFHLELDGWLYDYSRQHITEAILTDLLRLAGEVRLPERIAAMFRGDAINLTEGRAALHTALRSGFAGSAEIQKEVRDSRRALSSFAAEVRAGTQLGFTGRPFRHVVNIGIGGSDLGPLLVCDALRAQYTGGITPHFVSNVDRTQLQDLTRQLDPAETLIIVCSKTFTTQETQANARAARDWIASRLGEAAVPKHFVAVSTNAAAMDAFGVAPDRRFTMWDWVGGRYSVWSAIGLVAELTLGTTVFEEFLAGASAVDRHFSQAPLERNLPVLMGLIGVWNRSFLGLPTLAVLPYDQRLARLPAYLQQLDMESNGKSTTLSGERVDYATAPVVWGEPGSNAQHSFFQMLHQGTLSAALDFIAPLRNSWGDALAQDLALSNCFAQAQAFAFGLNADEVAASMQAAKASEADIARLTPHRVHEGNRPSSVLLYGETNARSLGGLLALYEHKIFVQGCIWGINSFDQFGVELGKKLAAGISMSGKGPITGPGSAAVAELIAYVNRTRAR